MTKQRVYRFFPAAVALLTLLAFLPALGNDWLNWDDDKNFLNNPNWGGLGWTQLKWMWTSHLMGRYIPVTWMTLGLDHIIWDLDPFGYHLTGILLHAANAVLFYFVAIALFSIAIPESANEKRANIPLAALFAALVFGLHPLRAESVAWVTERRDLVSGMFYLLAILAYLRAFHGAASPRIERRGYLACFVFFILAVLSKEITVTLPLLLLLLDVYPLRRLGPAAGGWFSRKSRHVWVEKTPFFVVSLASSALSLYVGRLENLTSSLTQESLLQRIAASTYGLAFYLWKTVAPFHLSPLYALTSHRADLKALPFQLSAMVVLGLGSIAVIVRRRWPALPIVCLAYIIALIPVLGIFQNGYQITADRYSYLACLGWAILAGGVLLTGSRAWPKGGQQTLGLAAALVVGGLGYLTWKQVQIWKDSETLWTKAIAVEPSFIACNNLGLIFSDRHEYKRAVEEYRMALRMNPEFELAHNNLGAALLELAEWEAAAVEFETALKLKPALASAHFGLGYARMKQGRMDDAIAQFQTALSLNPGWERARDFLTQALAMKASGP